MPALKTRSRVVVFRLTEEEFNLLQDACRISGGRNLSDFTRTGILNHLENRTKPDPFAAIEDRLNTLQQEIRALSAKALSDASHS